MTIISVCELREDLSLLSLLDGQSRDSASGNNDWGWDDHPDNFLITQMGEDWLQKAGELVEIYPWRVTAILAPSSSFVWIY